MELVWIRYVVFLPLLSFAFLFLMHEKMELINVSNDKYIACWKEDESLTNPDHDYGWI